MQMKQLFDLEGKVAIVTGGNGGLGLAMATGLAAAGANIVVAARNPAKTAAALAQIEAAGAQALGISVDVSEESDINGMVTQTLDTFGRVDILVNNAGVTVRREPQDLSADEWDHVLDVNLRAAFLASRAVYPSMKAQGWRKTDPHRIDVSRSSEAAGAVRLIPPAKEGSFNCPRAWPLPGQRTISSPTRSFPVGS